MAGGHKIATPGGIVESTLCGDTGDDFDTGAAATAIKELNEEAGLHLDPMLHHYMPWMFAPLEHTGVKNGTATTTSN